MQMTSTKNNLTVRNSQICDQAENGSSQQKASSGPPDSGAKNFFKEPTKLIEFITKKVETQSKVYLTQ